ncbi:LLM class flavin-dependent oxidoreductase [Roseibaca sp. V10]|uniref:LLM class flavin-dependent oxidoreductase n=1 Tax=Roseinatronobacter domitianus TaxID=2940293 RepID=A0ABT0LZS8_9RHOB|nr:MupA/Atu3671 family FMN-dependent luciferase-like monooxygenase [Roseibaca domitiana]MCL1627848.1 LLM class flavin-dependent oxidoreductase [Roseibaca domitiana]
MTQFSSILIGDETLTAECGAQILARGHSVAAVVTDNPRVADWATDAGLNVLTPGAGLAARLAGLRVDWLFNVAGLRMLGRDVLDLPRNAAINFHDGPLPRHAGLNAPVWALLNDEPRHGIAWHIMEDGVDTGDVLMRAEFDITSDDTALTLNTKCFSAGLDSFAQVLDMLESGQLIRQPQDMSARSVHTRADRPALGGQIDPRQTMSDIMRLVRAMDHGPYWNPLTTAKLRLGETVICLGHAEPATGHATPGTVLDVTENSLTLACADGALRLSGLTCQQGHAVIPAAIAAAGDTIANPDTRLHDVLTQIGNAELGYRDALRAASDLGLGRGTPSDMLALSMGDATVAQQIAAFAGALAAQFGRDALRMAHVTRAGAEHAAQASDFLLGWVPLAVQMDDTGPLTSLATQITRATRAPALARDLPARDPQLGPIAPPELAVTDGTLTDAALVLDLSGPCLRFDPACLSHEQAEALKTQIEMLGPKLADLPLSAQIDAPAAPQDDTARDYDRICIHHAFEAQVAKTPDAEALTFEAQRLTYAELNARANRVAHVLLSMGLQPDTPVALCAKRGPNLLVGALGILKAGGAYVPLDPAYPSDRLAHYLTDSGAPIVVTEHALLDVLPNHAADLLQLDTDSRLADAPATNPDSAVTADNLAYLIYTSGSTGTPKGVMVEHSNVANFFAGMDDCIRHDPPGVWLAVTSLSFDISVLELFWTLARGFKIVLMGDEDRAMVAKGPVRVSDGHMDFSLMYWGNDDGQGPQKYHLLLEGAKFADTHGFCAVWTPERHFHAFGGPFANPSVSGAAVAAVTKNIAVRAGSCVAPLHSPIRIAEEWAMIDNLTNGRTGIGIASGWHPVDFVLRPENRPPNNKAAMFDTLDTLRKLWRGETVEFDKGDGMVPIQTLPRPVSSELNIWLTTAGNPDTWREAGRLGAHVLTHLLGQSIAEVEGKIKIYHEALRETGYDPAKFTVTLMLHTFVARDRDHAREVARGPMKSYLLAAAGLVKQYAWAFPAFKKPQGAKNPMDIDLSTLSEDEVEGILDYAFNRYFEDSGLFGTVEDCLERVEQLKAIGVNEVACLIDYGIATEQVLEGLYPLAEVVKRSNAGLQLPEDDFSLAAQILRHKVTHLQCTPSMARMLCLNDEARAALATVPNVMLGGEALPGALAQDLSGLTGQPLRNMYGPTETTIWSSTAQSRGGSGTVGIGAPIANTTLHVLDDAQRPVALGIEGELYIGGDGVTRGYWNRAELTAERFIENPYGPGRLYRTGDLVRRNPAGGIDFLGRVDNQVKLRGHRIELGEIEAALEAQPGINAAVVIAREDQPGDVRLVAYYTGTPTGELRAALADRLTAHMLPAHYVPMASLPLTPNKKIDRKALPAPVAQAPLSAPEPVTGTQADGSTQSTIAQVWQDVLGVARVQASDNFFNLGGHSLLAVQAHRDLRTRLNMPGLSITDIFRFPVLGDLARHLEAKQRPAKPASVQPLHPAPDATAQPDRLDATARRRAMRDRRTGSK